VIIWIPIILSALLTAECIGKIQPVVAWLDRLGISVEFVRIKSLVWSIFVIWTIYAFCFGG